MRFRLLRGDACHAVLRRGRFRCLMGMTDHSDTTEIVVIGGGYAGVMAANRLRKRQDVTVTLVNPRPRFVERIRLHQFVARTRDAALDYDTLLGNGVRLLVDRATRIDTGARTVLLASGRVLDYDYVIYAVGSTADSPTSVPGAAEFAHPIGEWEHAERLRTAIDELAGMPGSPLSVAVPPASKPPPNWLIRAAPSRWWVAAGWRRRSGNLPGARC